MQASILTKEKSFSGKLTSNLNDPESSLLRYIGNIPKYHSQVDTANSPAQVDTGEVYPNLKYGNRLDPFSL